MRLPAWLLFPDNLGEDGGTSCVSVGALPQLSRPMSFFIDILPIAGFLVAYFGWGIYAATGVLMVGSLVQVAAMWLWKRRVEKLHLFSLGLALVLGGLTLWLHNENFIKWKPSLFLWLGAAIILGRQWFGKQLTIKSLIEKVMAPTHPVEDAVWQRVNAVWGWAMALAGALNLAVAYTLPLSTWVVYKLVSLVVLNLTLAVYTSVALREPDQGSS